jgi:hypothetical protein
MQEADPQIHFAGKLPGAGRLDLKSIGAARTAAAASAIPDNAEVDRVTAAAAAGEVRKVRRSIALSSSIRRGAAE